MNNEKIEGIHVYCDRWCERCTFKSRCVIYESENHIPREERDISNQAFWNRLAENFSKAREILLKAAADAGVDLEKGNDAEADDHRRKEALQTESRRHPLALLSLEYAHVGREWLKTQPGMLDRLEDLKQELILGVENEQGAKRQTFLIRESLSVIQWYLQFIHIKLSRALMGKLSAAEWQDEERYQRDYDGSAKIARIAIDRSMQAWSAIFNMLPHEEDHFLNVLSMLESIRIMTVKEFPDAMSFVRPGFDEITTP